MGMGMDIAANAANQGIGAIFGLMTAGINDRRQREQQEHLQNLQIKGNKEMADYNYQKQLDMWHATNYSAQMKEMRAAGLNPGLMYGMSGGGATTTGSGGGPGVQGASAQQNPGEMALGLQAGMNMAQMELMRAQANNLNADTENKRGIERGKAQATIDLNNAQTGNVTADTKLKEIALQIDQFELNIKNATREDVLDKIHQEARKLTGEATQALVAGNIATNTRQAAEDQIYARLAQTYLQNSNIAQDTKLKKEETAAVIQSVQESIQRVIKSKADIYQTGVELSLKGKQILVQEALNDIIETGVWVGASAQVISGVVDILTKKYTSPAPTLPTPVRGFQPGQRNP